MFDFHQLLDGAIKLTASDVHLVPDYPPVIRVHSNLRAISAPPLKPAEILEVIEKILTPDQRERYAQERGVDFSYQLASGDRFRCAAAYDRDRPCLTMRIIPAQIPSPDDLSMPESVVKIAMIERGMILVTGITGSGKSTTLASLLDYINQRRARRIITIEDPIEYLYRNNKSIITQREVGQDINNFSSGLRQSLRMDPDIILIGEMRDIETIETGIHASETGHVVMSTLHTTSVLHTVQRIIGQFPISQHDLVREQISQNLKAAITQRLVRTADKKGRMAAMEILIVNDVVAKLIREDRVMDCFGIIRSGDEGMQAMDQALGALVRAKTVTMQEATKWCDDYYALKRYVSGMSGSGDKGGIL